MTKPSPEALVALAIISKHPKWGEVNKYIEASINSLLEVLVENRDDVELHRTQGAVKALKSFQRQVREASDAMEKRGLQAPL